MNNTIKASKESFSNISHFFNNHIVMPDFSIVVFRLVFIFVTEKSCSIISSMLYRGQTFACFISCSLSPYFSNKADRFLIFCSLVFQLEHHFLK